MRTRPARIVAVAGGLVVLVSGGAYAVIGQGSDASRKSPVGTSTVSVTTAFPTSTSEATTTTTEPPETTTTEPQMSDGDIVAAQERLSALGYDVGPIDGRLGPRMSHTVMAFQKVEGLARTGALNDETVAALGRASRPGPLVPGGPSNRVEIDLSRQVLFLWQGGSLARILPVSTGNGEYYCVDGECDTAITPTGAFRVGRKYAGLEVSRLGELWSPSYFYGGIAVHGSPSIPPYPASHGCVRVPMYAAASLHAQMPTGMHVYVVGDGPSAAAIAPPPDEPVRPPDPPPPPVDGGTHEPAPSPTTTEPTTSTTTTEPPPSTTTTTLPVTPVLTAPTTPTG